MSLSTPVAVLLAILFLIPGLIWKKTADVASPYQPRGKPELLECLMLSCLNYLLAAVLFGWLYIICCPDDVEPSLKCLKSHLVYFLLWVLPVFVLPLILGIVTAKLAKNESIKGFFRRFGISVLHPAPTAWDYVFAREDRYWARVELPDGKIVEGVFDSASLASSEKDERDLFLEAVYEFDEASGKYEKVDRNQGMWIGQSQIRTITFFQTAPKAEMGIGRDEETYR